MKNILVALFAVVLLSSCGKSWPDADREKFLTQCKGEDQFGVAKEKVGEFCDCQLGVYQKHFKDFADYEAGKNDMSKMDVSMVTDLLKCMPDIGK